MDYSLEIIIGVVFLVYKSKLKNKYHETKYAKIINMDDAVKRLMIRKMALNSALRNYV